MNKFRTNRKKLKSIIGHSCPSEENIIIAAVITGVLVIFLIFTALSLSWLLRIST